MEFPCGRAGYGSGIVTAAPWATAVAWIHSLAWELPHAGRMALKKKKIELEYARKIFFKILCQFLVIDFQIESLL